MAEPTLNQTCNELNLPRDHDEHVNSYRQRAKDFLTQATDGVWKDWLKPFYFKAVDDQFHGRGIDMDIEDVVEPTPSQEE